MSDPLHASKRRFSGRVENYARFRPRYPAEVISLLSREIGLNPTWVVVDVGAGTGLSSTLFLDHGNEVYAVEPNLEMRAEAERLLESNPRFHSIAASAEDTRLPQGKADLVVAAQAFHWFEPTRAREEFTRILQPQGWIVLMWNRRLTRATPFLCAYEELLLRYGIDYMEVRHENVDADKIKAFFAGSFRLRSLSNQQRLTLEGLKGRLLSSSYVPGPDQPHYDSMIRDLEHIFAEHELDGLVSIDYSLDLYFGQAGG